MEQIEVKESAVAELRARNRAIVVGVAKAYREACNLPVMCARDYDLSPVSCSRIWTPTVAHYKADCEAAVRKIVSNKSDAEELTAAWERLQTEDGVMGSSGMRFIKLAAPIFTVRELEPNRYFRVNKYPQRAGR
jgi:hypothetical protein